MKISKHIKIGITSHCGENLFGNGLKSNVFFLYKLLKNVGYNVDMVSESDQHYGKKLCGFELKKLDAETISEYNIIIQCANSLSFHVQKILKDNGGIVGSCEYGNKILIDMGTMLYKEEGNLTLPEVDFYWTSPHFERTKNALETLSKCPVSICPYIWSPEILTLSYMAAGYNPHFGDHVNLNNISIMESNLYMVKMCFIPMLITEELHNRNPELINHVYNVGSSQLKDKKNFVRFANKLSIVKDKKMTFEGRWALNFLLEQNYAGTIVSHQWCNELNYLQLEAMYLNRPFVHNSPTFKEHGYYFPDFDVHAGADALEEAIKEHPKRYLEDRKTNEELMWKYSPNNSKNIQGYIELIEEQVQKHFSEGEF